MNNQFRVNIEIIKINYAVFYFARLYVRRHLTAHWGYGGIRGAVQLADCTFFIPVMYLGRSVASQSKRDSASDIYGLSQEQCYRTDLHGPDTRVRIRRTVRAILSDSFSISRRVLSAGVSKGFAEIPTSTISYCLLFSPCTASAISQIEKEFLMEKHSFYLTLR